MKVRIHKLKKTKLYRMAPFLVRANSALLEIARKEAADGNEYELFVNEEDFIGEVIEEYESEVIPKKDDKIYSTSLNKVVKIVDIVHNMGDVLCVVNEEQIIETEYTETSRQRFMSLLDQMIENTKRAEESDKAFREMMMRTQSKEEKGLWEKLFSRG